MNISIEQLVAYEEEKKRKQQENKGQQLQIELEHNPYDVFQKEEKEEEKSIISIIM